MWELVQKNFCDPVKGMPCALKYFRGEVRCGAARVCVCVCICVSMWLYSHVCVRASVCVCAHTLQAYWAFTGVEAVDWLVAQQFAKTREAALHFGWKLWGLGIVSHVKNGAPRAHSSHTHTQTDRQTHRHTDRHTD